MKKQEMIFLVPSIEQPRVLKRIIEESNNYEKIKVFAFTRNIYRMNNFSKLDEINNIDYEIVGSFKDSDILGRFIYFKLLAILYLKYGFRKKEIYVFGFDLRLVSSFLLNTKIKYEISDIIWLYKKGFIKMLMSKIDFSLARSSYKIIFTSYGFYSDYYSFLDESRVLIKENKFKTYGLVNPITDIISNKIRIAYIGAFRYEDIINTLIEICKEFKNKIILNFYGDGAKIIIDQVKNAAEIHENIHYFGAFKNPDDLEKIYGENNVNFVAYNNKSQNERVAMPNKFYESGYFNIPIVASNYTYLGKRVAELNMGWIIDPNKEGITRFIENLSIQEIIEKHIIIKGINKRVFEEQ